MIRKAIYSLERAGLVLRRGRYFSEKKPDGQAATTKAEKKPEPANQPIDEDGDEYEDYGEVKIRKGGRRLQVEEEEVIDTTTKSKNALSYVFRALSWGAFSYWLYQYYQYYQDPKLTPTNVVDEYFLEAVKYVDKGYRKVADLFTKPAMDKLLPEIPMELYPAGFEFPKTLLINLTGTTIHTKFELGKGREVIKRPGLDEIIKYFGQQCEIVIFSDDEPIFLQNIFPKLDPSQQRIAGLLGHESMVLEGTKRIKDLKYINRDIKKIIVIESNPDRLKYHQENGIFLSNFDGNPDDKELYKLIPFLEYLINPSVKDIREELKKYGNYNPGDRYIEQLKKRKQELQNKSKGGISGMLGGQKGNFSKGY